VSALVPVTDGAEPAKKAAAPQSKGAAATKAPSAPKTVEAAASTPAVPAFEPSKEDLAAIKSAYEKLYKDPSRVGAKGELEAAEAILTKEIEKWSPYQQYYPEDWARLHLARAQARITLNEMSRGGRPDKAQGAVLDYGIALLFMEMELSDGPAKEVYDEYPDALIRRAMALEDLNQWDRAVADYTKAISLTRAASDKSANSPGVNPLVLSFRGTALGRLGRYDEAVLDFREAAAVLEQKKAASPQWAQPFWNSFEWMGMDFMPLGVREELRDAAMCQCNEGLALYGAGRPDEALKTWEEVLKKDNALTDAHVALAAALWSRGDAAKAKAQWKFACEEIDVGCSDFEDIKWVSEVRRWPQPLVNDLEAFLKARSA